MSVTGPLVASDDKRAQSVELHQPSVQVVGECPVKEPLLFLPRFILTYQEYPMHKQGLPVEHLRTHAHLRARTNAFGATLRVRNQSMMSVHNFFQAFGVAATSSLINRTLGSSTSIPLSLQRMIVRELVSFFEFLHPKMIPSACLL